MEIDRSRFLVLAAALAASACAAPPADDTTSGSGALASGPTGESGGAAPSVSTAPSATPAAPTSKMGAVGEFDRDSAAGLFVIADDGKGKMTFSVSVGAAQGDALLEANQAVVTDGNLYRWTPTGEGNCSLELTPAGDGGWDVTEQVIGDRACDLHGAGVTIGGHYAPSSATPVVGKYIEGDGTYGQASVTAASSSSVAFTIDVTGSIDHTGTISGTATKTADPSTFAFSQGSGDAACSLKLHFGKTALVVEDDGCAQPSNGIGFAAVFTRPG